VIGWTWPVGKDRVARDDEEPASLSDHTAAVTASTCDSTVTTVSWLDEVLKMRVPV
jgi:hypothetical protein